MLNSYYTEKLLGLQEVAIKNIEEKEERYEISIEQPRKICICSRCGEKTSKIHDYRYQRIKELPAFEKKVVLILRKRRYVCSCGKRFFEPNTFLAKYQRMTQRAIMGLLEKLRDSRSYTSVAREFDVSVSTSTVIRFFKNVQYSKPAKLPDIIGIDEFKGNSGGEKFHGILTDIGERKVVDILKTRYEHDLCDYFKKYDRTGVKYFVSDMYKPYAEIAEAYFPNATYVIDRYHWVRQAVWAFEAVRKEVQKQFSKKHRIYFKKSRHLLLKHRDKLNEDELQQVLIMLDSILFDNLVPREFRYKDGNSGRLHYGYIVDELKAAMDIAGLTAEECAAYCLRDKSNPDGDGGIRYDELSILTAYEVQKIKAHIVELETLIKQLTNKE